MNDRSTTASTLAVMGRSRKKDERRLALHPDHLLQIPSRERSNIYLESGYGESFGITDTELALLVGGVGQRADLIANCEVILQPKPVLDDILELRPGQVFWGWPHCVQGRALTQAAIDNRLTVIAFEAMNYWNDDGSVVSHVFNNNNELAGYSSVLHALQLVGITGHFGQQKSAVIIGFGATARGAARALEGLGFGVIDVLTRRDPAALTETRSAIRPVRFFPRTGHEDGQVAIGDTTQSVAGYLAQHDIVVNCTLQDPNSPMMFLDENDLESLAPETLIIDVSCDAGMGFSWALPTSFENPMFTVGNNVRYYAVDHSPSYLWAAATWENSRAILPFLPIVMGGPGAWSSDSTIRRAIEIRDGIVQNSAILDFQSREPSYPHSILPLSQSTPDA